MFYIFLYLILSQSLSLLFSIFKMMSFKGDLKAAGEIIVKEELEYIVLLFTKIYLTALVVFGIYLLAVIPIAGICIMIFAGYQIIDVFISKRYYKVNGFYDNGLIRRTSFIAFKDILNYDIESDSKLVIHLKKGGQFDYEPEYGLELMKEKLEEINVQQREIP